jgi:DNA-binding transcriptional regulator YhcF (GntR family)
MPPRTLVASIDLSLNRDQFAVVVAALRDRFREGEWVEGEPLTVADIAAQCGVSATPVREALSRLAGEGLVEDRRGRGYYALRIDAVDLIDLYRTQHFLAQVALSSAFIATAAPPAKSWPAADEFVSHPVRAWEALFEALVRHANNRFLLGEQRRLADHLAPARRLEPEVLAETPYDFQPLIQAAGMPDLTDLGAVLKPFIRRRKAAAERLVAGMRLASAKYKISI